MTALSAIAGILAILIAVLVTLLSIQVLMALPGRRPRPLPPGRRPSAGILIPAHDEAAVIAETLGSILPQLATGDRMLVIADNCSDETASIARQLGAEVVERTDPERRGKDYALDFGVHRLRDNPPEVIIIIDADCQVHPGTIDRLARVCNETSHPVQALYRMRSPAGAGPKTRIAEFAWIVKNQVRPLGNLRLGLPCQLMGTGMAFPWVAISNAALVSGHLAEDMKFGIDLALAGYPAVFCPDATVTSYFPCERTAVSAQRMRWEHGHLSVILHELPRMLARALSKRDIRLLGLAADLMVPPLSLLVLFNAAVFLLSLMLFLYEGIVWPFHLSLIALGFFGVVIAMAWHCWGRKIVSFPQLLIVPFYMLSKIPLYLRFLTGRQRAWIKTRRD
ncbi:MAG: glycosyltransferase family 2 protein [Sulfuricaulis sp.]